MPETHSHIHVEDIQLPQPELTSDLIGNPPGWILHTGISTVAFVVVMVLIGAVYIQYPDRIVARGIITTDIAPLEVRTQNTGTIADIYILNHEQVVKEQELFYLKNTASKVDMIRLKEILEEMSQTSTAREVIQVDMPNDLEAGVLSQGYANLINLQRNLASQLAITSIDQQKETLKNEIEQIELLNASLNREKTLYKKELDLTIQNSERNNMLLQQGVISDLEYENIQKVLLQQKRQYESMGSRVVQNNVRIEQLKYQTTKSQEDYHISINATQQNIKNLLTDLKEQYRQWYQRYHILSEGYGKVEIKSNIEEGIQISANQIAAYIVPSGQKNQKYVKALVPSQGIGKISRGDRCIIRIDAYPYKEYGSILSTIDVISQIPDVLESGESLYEATIPISDLISDQGKEIKYRPNMDAEIQIITESRSILNRIFEELNNIISLNK